MVLEEGGAWCCRMMIRDLGCDGLAEFVGGRGVRWLDEPVSMEACGSAGVVVPVDEDVGSLCAWRCRGRRC